MTTTQTQEITSSFEIIEGDKRGFELRIVNDGWWKARAVIYDQWIAEKLAKELGITIQYSRFNTRYEKEAEN